MKRKCESTPKIWDRLKSLFTFPTTGVDKFDTYEFEIFDEESNFIGPAIVIAESNHEAWEKVWFYKRNLYPQMSKVWLRDVKP